MNKLAVSERVRIVSALVEGCSVRSTCRMTGAAKDTVLRLVADLGEACDEFQDRAVRGLATERVQCDEIWGFCYCKDRNVPKSMLGRPGIGSVWTWTAIDADSKLAITWYVGDRDAGCARRFMLDVASRVDNRIQLTTDGHHPYWEAVALAFPGASIDFAQLVKLYGGTGETGPDGRYSPAECCGVKTMVRMGDPDLLDVSTSYVERQNLTMRMSMRRLTRLTNGFSKKIANLEASVALHFMHYNFCRPHMSLSDAGEPRRTPAMAAGLADHVWTLAELVALLPERRAAAWGSKSRGLAVGVRPDG